MPALLATFVVAAGLALPASTGSAASRAGIVIHGSAHSGSTLQVSVSGDRLAARGLMGARPRGCRVTAAHFTATCPLDGVRRIEIVMGAEGDEVQILDRLPAPLIVHLGSGPDRFVGNGERDTCYSEGARRNRCIGAGGRDVCITGQRNSDCEGGGGDDLCIHGGGSDGCWGGPGDDVCRMGPGQDGCHGGPGSDRLYGGSAPDQLYGGGGHDYCDGQRGVGRSHTCEAGPRH